MLPYPVKSVLTKSGLTELTTIGVSRSSSWSWTVSDADTVQARATDLYAGLAAGTLSLSLGRRYAMEQIGLAHANVEERKTGGKPLLDIAVELA